MSSAHLMMMVSSWVDTQSCVYRLKSFGLKQQPFGVPVLIVSFPETRLPILTTCCPSVSKSRIQLLVGVGMPRFVSLSVCVA